MTLSRRQLRAGLGQESPAIPARIARFDPADWPATAAEPDGMTGADGYEHAVARFYAGRRWRHAQRAYAAEHGMTINELRRAPFNPPG